MIISIPNYKDETEATCASILSVLMQQYFADPPWNIECVELKKRCYNVLSVCFFDYHRTDVYLLARTLTERGYCNIKTLGELGIEGCVADECGNCYQLTEKGIATYNASPDRE
jgi:hypothetical protein